jgi:hypothetical protein
MQQATQRVGMIEAVRTALTGQFEAALAMLHGCVRRCPLEHWEKKVANDSFRQIAYHTLFYADYYLSPGESAFELRECHRRGGDERGPDLSAGLEKGETIAYLATCREKLLATMAAETGETLAAPCGFSRWPFSRIELHVYNVRHVQHHTGALSAFLRKVAEDKERWWVATGWRE